VNEFERVRARSLLGKEGYVELVAVLVGIKSAMRAVLGGRNARALARLVSDLGLRFAESPFAVVLGDVHAGMVHTYSRINSPPVSDDCMRLVYVGADEMAARLAAAFDATDARRLGAVLGYPCCCVDFYCDHFQKGYIDLIPAVAPPAAGSYRSAINVVGRRFGHSLISHIPCRWDCEASLDIANAILNELRRSDPRFACEVSGFLASDVVYSEEWVAEFRDPQWEEDRLLLTLGTRRTAGKTSGDSLRFCGDGAAFLKDGHIVAEIPRVFILPFASGTLGAFFQGRNVEASLGGQS
jgi:hypothetical protein